MRWPTRKTAIEATRYLSWRACHAVDTQSSSPPNESLRIQAKIYGSETAVSVITDLMRVVGIDSYDHEAPLGHLLQDALALPIFGGGNIGVRRRLHLHAEATGLRAPARERCGSKRHRWSGADVALDLSVCRISSIER